MKRLILPILAVVAVGFATISILRTHPQRSATEPPAPPPVSAYQRTVAAVGLIEPNSENVAIGTPLPGVIREVFVQAGQAVKAGDALFQIDERHLRAELGVREAALVSARAQVQTARANLDDARDQFQRASELVKDRVISADDFTRRKFALQASEARFAEAEAGITSASAQIEETKTEIERSTVLTLMDADVLQVKVRAGEFAPAGQTSEPLLILGRIRPLHVRVDVDENEGWRIRAEAPATAHVRGNTELKVPLRFVRFEPLVVPKRSLTGESTERVDTRVLQVIYEITGSGTPLFVGQQMDVFIEDAARETAAVHRP